MIYFSTQDLIPACRDCLFWWNIRRVGCLRHTADASRAERALKIGTIR